MKYYLKVYFCFKFFEGALNTFYPAPCSLPFSVEVQRTRDEIAERGSVNIR